ncbi:MAG: MBOAT family protein [Agathobacter sp.]|nr:MBOAT family protein [Agathobacter sp.]
MSFTSYEFILAVAAVVVIYYSIPKRFQWMFLLGASYLLYFSADPSYLIFISITTLTTYLAAKKISRLSQEKTAYLKENKTTLDREAKKAYKEGVKKKQRLFLHLALLVDLGLLIGIKYTNFIIENINGIITSVSNMEPISYLDIIMPLGISFYTFQTVGYLVDVYNEKYEAQNSYGKFALFVGFFPQLSQGPISRYNDLSETLYAEHKFDTKVVAFGLQRILWGYFKKLVIADRVLIGLKTLLAAPENYPGVYFFVAMMFYAIQLYADFTGGIDITIGIAETMGIKVKENFMRPYFSKNIKEYWNRWHMTMGSWFTDYIFYPISVSGFMLKLSKKARQVLGENIGKRVPVYLATILVWFTTGIWHGASWNFIVWGLANCVVILISQELSPLYVKFHNRFDVEGKLWYKTFCVIRTILLMSALRMFDCYRDVTVTIKMFFSMFTTWNISALWDGSMLELGLNGTDYLIILFGVVLIFTVSMLQRRKQVRERILALPYPARAAIWLTLFVVVLLAGAYGQGYDESSFIYNQF